MTNEEIMEYLRKKHGYPLKWSGKYWPTKLVIKAMNEARLDQDNKREKP